jgi:hypothetical protein
MLAVEQEPCYFICTVLFAVFCAASSTGRWGGGRGAWQMRTRRFCGVGCSVPPRQKSIKKSPDHMKNSRPVFAKSKFVICSFAYSLTEKLSMLQGC